MNENNRAPKNDPRKERLAKALRDNLKRRKAQARERAATGHPGDPAAKVSDRKD
jgi:hypothetical protein